MMLNLHMMVGKGEDVVHVDSSVMYDWRTDYKPTELVTFQAGRSVIVMSSDDAVQFAKALLRGREADEVDEMARRFGYDDPDVRFDGISAHFGHD